MTDGGVVVGFLICVAAGYLLQPTAVRAWLAVRSWRPRLEFSDTGIEVYWLSSLGAAYKTQEEALRHLQAEYANTRKDLRQSIQDDGTACRMLGSKQKRPASSKADGA